MRTSSSWPNHLPKPHLLIPSHWGLTFNIWIFGGYKHSVYSRDNRASCLKLTINWCKGKIINQFICWEGEENDKDNMIKYYQMGNLDKDIWEFFVLLFQCFFKSKMISKQILKVKKIKKKTTPRQWTDILTQALASLISCVTVRTLPKFSMLKFSHM